MSAGDNAIAFSVDTDDEDVSVGKLEAECVASDDDEDNYNTKNKFCPDNFPKVLRTSCGSSLLEFVYCGNERNRKIFDKDHRNKEYVVAKKITILNDDGTIKFNQVIEVKQRMSR